VWAKKLVTTIKNYFSSFNKDQEMSSLTKEQHEYALKFPGLSPEQRQSLIAYLDSTKKQMWELAVGSLLELTKTWQRDLLTQKRCAAAR
jgi:DNA-directed RNA polymerase subunit F